MAGLVDLVLGVALIVTVLLYFGLLRQADGDIAGFLISLLFFINDGSGSGVS